MLNGIKGPASGLWGRSTCHVSLMNRLNYRGRKELSPGLISMCLYLPFLLPSLPVPPSLLSTHCLSLIQPKEIYYTQCLVGKPDNLSQIPRSHVKVEVENQLTELFSDCHTCNNILNSIKNMLLICVCMYMQWEQQWGGKESYVNMFVSLQTVFGRTFKC